jgi:hypothetical protein
MRAVVQRVFGDPEVLKVVDVPAPSPLPTEIVVRVNAASINPIDAFIRAGRFPQARAERSATRRSFLGGTSAAWSNRSFPVSTVLYLATQVQIDRPISTWSG